MHCFLGLMDVGILPQLSLQRGAAKMAVASLIHEAPGLKYTLVMYFKTHTYVMFCINTLQ